MGILDVGATDSLLMFEILKRGYMPIGIDLRPYHVTLPKNSCFYRGDITTPNLKEFFKKYPIYMAVALSTIEHIGLPCYGGPIISNGDRLAIENIHSILDDNGLFIITIPTKIWQSASGRGYTPKEFYTLIEGLFKVFEITQRGGQICAALTKL